MANTNKKETDLPSVQLPCNFGDTVWGLENYCNDCFEYSDYCHRDCTKPSYRLKEFVVKRFEVYEDGMFVCGYSHSDMYGRLGEDVFLTREEAEAALEKANQKK